MSSNDSDDDFGPVIPPPLKKERQEDEVQPADPEDQAEQSDDATAVNGGGEESCDRREKSGDAQSAAEQWWSFFTFHSDLPSAPLYERSFLHDRVAEAQSSSSLSPKASPFACARVADVAVLEDSLGSMVCSIDEAGVLRVWRMLPSGGLFFLGEQDRFFPHASADADGKMEKSTTTSYYLCVNSTMQWVILVQVKEGPPSATNEGTRDVHVDVKRVNPLTLTVEAKSECVFSVNGDFTRRPFLLQHRYEPHLAFFVGATKPSLSAMATPASGVVLLPCFPPPSPTSQHGLQSLFGEGGAPRVYRATRLSTAHRVVACAQQPRGGGPGTSASRGAVAGSERGSPALVLVDAKGIIDYATVEGVSVEEEDAVKDAVVRLQASREGEEAFEHTPPTTGLTLRIIGGLSMCPRGSPVSRLWSRWVRFQSRQKTGFFSLFRATQRACRERAEKTGGGLFCGSYAIPLGVALSQSGCYFAVSALKVEAWLVKSEREAFQFRAVTGQSVYLFDFPTGQCIGSADSNSTRRSNHRAGSGLQENVREHLVTLARNGLSAEETFSLKMSHLASSSFAGVSLFESSAVLHPSDGTVGNGLYALVPEVDITDYLQDEKAEKEKNSDVAGRAVLAFQVAFPARQNLAPSATHSTTPETDCLPGSVGELEGLLRCWEGPPHPARAATTPPVPAKLADALHVPLVILRRSVAPSQDLTNLLGRSAVGAALTPADLKKCVFDSTAATSQGHRSTHGAKEVQEGVDGRRYSVTDRLAVTTSLGNESLLVYLSAASSATPETAHLSALNRSAAIVRRLVAAAVHGVGGGGEMVKEEEGAVVDSLKASTAQWQEVKKEIQSQRNSRCGCLLALSAQSLAEQKGDGDAVEADPSSRGNEEKGVQEKEAADSLLPKEEGGDDVNASASPGATAQQQQQQPDLASLTPAEREDAAVAALLRDALASLPDGGSAPAAKPKRQPSAFLTVRGYGMIQVHFLPAVAPLAVRSFTTLARNGYYTNLSFHRVIPGMMIQGGCPRGDGTGGESGLPGGGPFPDENLTLFPFFSHTDRHQWLCMANAGKDTNGSQFFITTPGAGSRTDSEKGLFWLNGKHTVFGYVVGGASVVKAMSEAPRDEQDKPLRPLVLERVDIL